MKELKHTENKNKENLSQQEHQHQSPRTLHCLILTT